MDNSGYCIPNDGPHDFHYEDCYDGGPDEVIHVYKCDKCGERRREVSKIDDEI